MVKSHQWLEKILKAPRASYKQCAGEIHFTCFYFWYCENYFVLLAAHGK